MERTLVHQFILQHDRSRQATPSWHEEGYRDEVINRIMGRVTYNAVCKGPGPTSTVTATWINGLRGAVAVEIAYGS